MTSTALVWLVVGLVSLVAVLAMLVGLIRHLIVLGRTIGRFQAEVAEVTGELEQASRRTRSRRPWAVR